MGKNFKEKSRKMKRRISGRKKAERERRKKEKK